MFDITKVEAEAKAELASERAETVKREIKAILKQIEDSKQITANLQLKYQAKLKELAA